MIAYSIKSVLCLLVLWGFYKLALEPLAAHQLKRFYLLGILLISLALPLFTIVYEVEVEPQPVVNTITYSTTSSETNTVPLQLNEEEKTDYLSYILFSIYGLGVLFFGFRFARNLYRINYKVRSSEKRRCIDHTKVLLEQQTVPHSFLHYIFLPKTDFETHKIALEVLEHELAHVSQKHSWDILAVEFLQVLFWFNPLLFWFKKSVALNHEFLADQKALHKKTDIEQYTKLLFQYSGGAHHTALSSPINYSLTRPPYNRAKKRIIMLSQTFSARKLATRLAFLMPVLALCIYFFNQDIVAKPVLQEEQQKQETQEPFVYKNEGDLRKNMIIKQKDLKRYAPNLGTDTLERRILTAAQLKDWQNTSKYGVWIDGKRIENSYLSNKKASDFDQYFVSKLEKNARKPGGASFQVDLMTPVYYKDHKIMDAMITTAQIKEYLTLKINIEDKKVSVNGHQTTLSGFSKTIDKITKDWTKEDMMRYSIHLRSDNGVDKFLIKLTDEFHKTRLYKTNPSRELIPPPPPPAPKPPKADEVVPPRPPALTKVSDNLTIKVNTDDSILINGQKTDLKSLPQAIEQITEVKEINSAFIDAPVIKAKTFEKLKGILNEKGIKKINTNILSPPAPPAPPSPEEMIIKMTAAGADFYYNGDKITAEKAKEIFKTKNDLNFMSTESKTGDKPMVLITDN